jgi:UPF0755 protein
VTAQPDSDLRRRRLALLAVMVIVVVIGAAVLAGMAVWTRITEPYKGYAAAEQFVEIAAGASPPSIRRQLVEAGVVRDDATFRAALRWKGAATRLRAGEYHFDRPMTAVEVVEKLSRGDVYTRQLTFREGLTIAEMADVYASNGFGERAAFLQAASDGSLVQDLDPAAPDLEGYLFPETYTLSRSTSVATLVARMVDGFRQNFPDAVLRAKEQGFTVREVVTLASLVEKETGRPEERPVVAAVYRNRLRIGMGMQADPTVVYALMLAGRYDGNIRRADLGIDSPYNTYRYPGLPPGPIAAPGRASIDAALAPADVPYLYFVSRNDGSHVFARTLAEHNANVYEHQVRYFRRGRQAK